ncbi:MAG: hypothetical protein SOW17_08230 [Clostridium sp.]|uniref:hypothetical protein n=1 Tax=Clostridium sp. TaxID=1506 RepID=UPI002A757981|nr:hypothetical protein [Clostridium sp.]MDY2580382.1 hypothetical protein [Clostridium sp.]
MKLFSNNPVKAALTIVFLGSMYSLVKAASFVERGINETKLIKKNNKEEGI